METDSELNQWRWYPVNRVDSLSGICVSLVYLQIKLCRLLFIETGESRTSNGLGAKVIQLEALSFQVELNIPQILASET